MSTDTAQPESTEDTQPLKVDMTVTSPSECLREVIVTIPQSEVARYLKKQYDEIVTDAQLPGFRNGRAPRRLVEKQFKDRVQEQVKHSLLMDSLAQVTETDQFSAIGEPEFDFESIKLPDEGDFKYQFKIEVRPAFDTPEWKGIDLTKPVETVDDEQINDALKRVLQRYATLEATDQPAALGDQITIRAVFKQNGKKIGEMDEEQVTLSDRLTFSDAVCGNFGEVMTGVTEDGVRTATIKFNEELDNQFAGTEADAEFSVVEVFKSETPELTADFLEELGDFESEEELRDFVRHSLDRQAEYRTKQAVRGRVTELLTDSAKFDLPPKLVQSQTIRELERKVLELRRSGFDENYIRSYVNASRQNAKKSTEAALREHFILEQIAEDEGIDAEDADYDAEIELIAEQQDVPVRRVRSQLEKSGQMDVLRNQIVENKVIDRIVEQASVTEKKIEYQAPKEHEEFSIYHNVATKIVNASIPDAKYDDNTPKPQKSDEKSE